MKQFWMVLNDNFYSNDMPKKRHETLGNAEQEAERLAEKQPGDRFIVLAAISHCTVSSIVWHKCNLVMNCPD